MPKQDENDNEIRSVPVGEPFAYTPDEVIAEGQRLLRESHPNVWEAWVRWCREQDEDDGE